MIDFGQFSGPAVAGGALASHLLYGKGTHDLLLVSVGPSPGLLVMPPLGLGEG